MKPKPLPTTTCPDGDSNLPGRPRGLDPGDSGHFPAIAALLARAAVRLLTGQTGLATSGDRK